MSLIKPQLLGAALLAFSTQAFMVPFAVRSHKQEYLSSSSVERSLCCSVVEGISWRHVKYRSHPLRSTASDESSGIPPLSSGSLLELIDIQDLGFNLVKSKEDRALESAVVSLVSTLDLTEREATEFLTNNIEILEVDDLLSKLFDFRWEMGLSIERLKEMILMHPKLTASLFLDNDHELMTTKDVLQTRFNVTEIEWEQLTKNNRMMRYSRQELRRKLAVYRNDIGLTELELKGIILSHPRVLQCSAENISRFASLLRTEINFSLTEIRAVVMRCPHIMTYCFDRNVEPTIKFLKEEIIGAVEDSSAGGISCVKHVILECPYLLSLSIGSKLCPTIQFLQKELIAPGSTLSGSELSRSLTSRQRYELRKVLMRVPEVLGYSVEKNLMPKIMYFRETVSFTPDELRKFIVKTPEILFLSLPRNVMAKAQYFMHELGFSRSELKRTFTACPSMVRLSLENNTKARIKTELSDKLGFDVDEIRAFLLGHPHLLWEGISHRMKGRIKLIKRKNISFVETPSSVLSGSEYIFKKWLRSQKGRNRVGHGGKQ